MVPDAPPDLEQWHARHNRGRRWAPSSGHPADLTSVVRRWNPLASRCWRAKPRRASHSATHADRRARSDLGACRGAPMPKFTPSTTHDPPRNQNRAAPVGRNAHRHPTLSAPRARPGARTPGPHITESTCARADRSTVGAPTHPIRRSHALPPNFTVDLGLGFAAGRRPSAARLARL